VIPLGTYNQIDLPMKPMDRRTTDVFFAGSVEHLHSLRDRLGSPKVRARRQMLAAVAQIAERRPDLVCEMRTTPSFEASATASPTAYSHALMDSKVCLAPRGTSVETFRFFEGLRAGCVVVTGGLPDHWFYSGAPVLRLDRWDSLSEVLAPVLDSPAEQLRLHEAALAWWRERCSEKAVARFMSDRLNRTNP
jgi:hypothetical protein